MKHKRITMLGLVMLAVLAIGGASAISVSASGHEFIASTSGTVTGKATDSQVIKTGAGEIECTSASATGQVSEGKATTHKEAVTYGSCVSSTGYTPHMSTVDFEFNANGSAKIENEVTVALEGAGCSVDIPAQSFSQGVSYTNESGKVTATAKITKIHSHGTGGACGKEEETTGTYTGSIQAELPGGSLEWK
jgi:hypothetical protein